MNAIKRLFTKLFRKPTNVTPVPIEIVPDEKIIESYVLNGKEFGDAVSYIYMGECVGFEGMLSAWEKDEHDYAALGYRTIPIDDFVSAGGYGKDITDMLRVPREAGEEPIYHAAFYRANYLCQVEPIINFEKMFKDGQPYVGTYAVPSTKHLGDKR